MQRVLIVGTSIAPLRSYLEEHGLDYIVLKDQRLAKHSDKKLKRRILCDFSTKESVLAAVASISQPIHATIAIYENFIVPTAWITEYLGLPGLSVAAAEACTDKDLMRQAFATSSEKISPDFAAVPDEETLREFAATHESPLILKPANLPKSLLVTKNHSLEELIKNYHTAMSTIQEVYEKYAPHRPPKLLVEEFLEGTIHSVDAFATQDGTVHVLDEIVDYQTGYDIGHDDNFHYSRLLPSKLSPQDQDALRHVAELGVQALGITSCPAHIEIIMTKDGPRIVEIGARNGGYRSRMYDLANGIDIHGAALGLIFGKQPHIQATKHEPCAVLELLPKQDGRFVGIKNEEAIRRLPSLDHFSIKAVPNQQVGKASEGFKMCAVIVLHNKDIEQFNRDVAFVNEHVSVVTA